MDFTDIVVIVEPFMKMAKKQTKIAKNFNQGIK
jgi:hypothetical protein